MRSPSSSAVLSDVRESSGIDRPRTAPLSEGRAVPHNFYCTIAIIVAVVVAIGFGRTVDAGLVHSRSARPFILYLHVAIFTSWVLIFIAQAGLVRFRRLAWHKRFGIAGGVLGAFMPLVGMWTAVVMTRVHRAETHSDTAGEAFLIVSVFDMLAFAVTFALAIYWRRRGEYHRRMMLMASCGLTVAAFARFPLWLMPRNFWYVYVDALILAGPVRDWIIMRRVHPVYQYGLPALAVGQATTMWIYVSRAPAWIAIAHALLG
jgi:hypothetical protein